MKRLVSLTFVAVLMAQSALAAEFWEKKQYKDWSEKECRQLLSNSPWARSHTIKKAQLKQLNRDAFGQAPRDPGGPTVRPSYQTPVDAMPAATSNDNTEGVTEPSVTYQASFRTATPVRQAIVRLGQMDAKYLAQKFDDKIIIQVTYEANVIATDRALANYWQSASLTTLANTVYLTGPDGERVEPIAFWAGKGASREIQFAFPRKPGGGIDMKRSILFEFEHPALGDDPKERITLHYPAVGEMKFDGAVSY